MEELWSGIKKNAINEVQANKKLVGYYEDLRKYSGDGSNTINVPLGLDLFLKKGATEWVIAWTDFKISAYKSPGNVKLETHVPEVLKSEVTMLLTTMVMKCKGGKNEYNIEF